MLDPDCPDCGDKGYTECFDCEGSGIGDDGDACPECLGDGEVECENCGGM